MRRIAAITFLLVFGCAGLATAERFVYTYRDRVGGDKMWRVRVANVEDGKVTTEEVHSAKSVQVGYSLVGASGDNVILTRSGERIAEWLNLKTKQINKIAVDFSRAVFVSPTEMVYLAHTGEEDTPGSPTRLMRFIFADGNSKPISDVTVLEQIPNPAPRDVSKAIDTFWGVFLVDGKHVAGEVDLATGELRKIAEIDAEPLCTDVSPDGAHILVGSADIASFPEASSQTSMAGKILLIDTATGETTQLARSIHQQIPENPGISPRFLALFAGNDHVLYPETVIGPDMKPHHQRLVAITLDGKHTKDVATIDDVTRLVNAVPSRTADGTIYYGEYRVDPTELTATKRSAYDGPDYTVNPVSRDLTYKGRLIGYVTPRQQVWRGEDAIVFVGRLDKTEQAELLVYVQGMERAERLIPESGAPGDVVFIK